MGEIKDQDGRLGYRLPERHNLIALKIYTSRHWRRSLSDQGDSEKSGNHLYILTFIAARV